MELRELEAMSEGLRIALKYSKDKYRFIALEGMYAESLVAMKLLENEYNVDFHGPQFDLLVDGKKQIEVKCGVLKTWGAGASFGMGKQITEDKFDYCVFVVLDRDKDYEPIKFFVFSREELKECGKHRPDLTEPNTPSILFYYKNAKDLEESEKKGELVFTIERELVYYPEKFEDKWDKISP